MSNLKTNENNADVEQYLQNIENPTRQSDANIANAILGEITSWKPRMWGDNSVGFGAYDYAYESGRSGRWFVTGFSPRKAYLSIYIMPGFSDMEDLVDHLGPCKMGKSCINITRLDKIDHDVLAKMISRSVDIMKQRYIVSG